MDMGVQLPCMGMGLLLYMEMAVPMVFTLGMGLAVQVFRLLWFERCGVKAASLPPLPQPDLLTSRCFCQRLPVAASSVACFLEAPRTEYHLHGDLKTGRASKNGAMKFLPGVLQQISISLDRPLQ